jgi:hypothetical protein
MKNAMKIAPSGTTRCRRAAVARLVPRGGAHYSDPIALDSSNGTQHSATP